MDVGAVIAQYFGTFLMTASYVAIGLFASSLTRNQMVALIIGLSIIGILTLAGLPIVTLALPSRVAVLIQDLSPLTHYGSITRGVLDLRDLLYFAALIMTFLSATYLMIRGKTVSHRSPRYRNLQFGVAALVLISLLVGWFGSFIGGRLDLTEQKLYTLDPATRDIVENLDDIVTIKLFTSQDPPVQISLVTRDVTDFADDLAAASNGRIKLQKIQADTSEEAAEEAERSFVRPQQFNLGDAGGTADQARLPGNGHDLCQQPGGHRLHRLPRPARTASRGQHLPHDAERAEDHRNALRTRREATRRRTPDVAQSTGAFVLCGGV